MNRQKLNILNNKKGISVISVARMNINLLPHNLAVKVK